MPFTILNVEVLPGIGGYWCNDQPAIQLGAEKDGFFFEGAPVTPGFRAIREPSLAYLCVLTLDDGLEALGDCTTVANAGYSGRPPPLREEDRPAVAAALDRVLTGRRFENFLSSLVVLRELELPARLATPVQYGLSQALLAAAALASRTSMAETLRRELGRTGPLGPPPGIAGSCGNESTANIDKAIARRIAMFPQSAIQTRAECEALPDLVDWIARRIDTVGAAEYRPDLHFDFHSMLGRMYDEDAIVDYLGDIVRRAAGLTVYFEDPLLARDAGEAAEKLAELRTRLRRSGIACGLIADQWANDGDAIQRFIALGSADAIQVKMPDNGSILNAIRSLEACAAAGVKTYLGGSCNETDISARVTAHLAVALDVWRVFTKPGLGFDEGLMVLTNELVRARRGS